MIQLLKNLLNSYRREAGKNTRLNKIEKAIVVCVVIGLASLIPIIQTYGKLTIGYDAFIPPVPENSFDMTYQWIDIDNGTYIGNNHVAWIGGLLFLKQVTGDIYRAAFLFQFLIFFLSGIGIYAIYNVFNKKNTIYGLLPAVFFILSPHLLDHMPYYQGTVGIVWSTYFIIKFLKYKNFTFIDVPLLSISLGIITDLPNPKYHFLLFILFIVAILIGLIIKLLDIRAIVRNLKYFILILLCTAYISVPLIHFGYSFFQTNDITINTRAGYEEFGQTLDYNVANLYKMITLFHITPAISYYYESNLQTLFLFVYYVIPFIIFGFSMFILPKLDLEKRKIAILYLILGLFFIFFSKSSNPPFGFVYEWILSSSQFFAFMRTTAGLVIYAAVFYSLIFGIVFQYLAENVKVKRYVLSLACAIILIAGFPVWSGSYFKMGSTDAGPTHGLRLPSDYFHAGAFERELSLDGKIDIYPYAQGYQGNKWGPWNYYGYIIYPWIFDKPIIAFNKTTPSGKITSFTNTRYFVHDKTIGQDNNRDFGMNKKGSRIFSSKTLDIYRKGDTQTLPHFYTPKTVRVAKDVEASIKKRGLSSDVAFYQSKDIAYSSKLQSINFTQPLIEYKKINPTKYRIRLHQAKGIFQLIFSENFHPDWKMYFGNNFPSNKLLDQHTWNKQKKLYFVDRMNESDQSSREEVTEMIASGSISTIGNTPNDPIQFISKKFLNTIQNDNLPSGHFYETFIKNELTSGFQHAKVNTFANAWIIDTDTLCKQISCIKNKNGTYDMELILEFWPQKLKNMTYVISIGTASMLLFAYLVNIIYRYLFRAKEA